MHKCFCSRVLSSIGWMSYSLQKCLCRRGERLLRLCIRCNFFSSVALSTWLFNPIQHISRTWPASWEGRHWDSTKKKDSSSCTMIHDLLQREKNHCSLSHPCNHSDTLAFSLFQIAAKEELGSGLWYTQSSRQERAHQYTRSSTRLDPPMHPNQIKGGFWAGDLTDLFTLLAIWVLCHKKDSNGIFQQDLLQI